MRGSPSKVFPLLGMTYQPICTNSIRIRRGAHIRVGGGTTIVDSRCKFALKEATGVTTVAGAEIASIIPLGRHPNLNVDAAVSRWLDRRTYLTRGWQICKSQVPGVWGNIRAPGVSLNSSDRRVRKGKVL